MGESVLFGDWLIANPKQIEILDFTAWNKIHDGKRNRWRFVPCLTFVVKGLFVEIAGYHEVWAFIDAIIPKLPRRELNEVMKGRSEGPTIIEELSAFLQESERTLLIELVLPDNGDFLRAVVIRGEDRPSFSELLHSVGGLLDQKRCREAIVLFPFHNTSKVERKNQ